MIWHHNDYSEEAIREMQKEAEERVREMQARSRLFSGPEMSQNAPVPPKAEKETPHFSPPGPGAAPASNFAARFSQDPGLPFSGAMNSLGSDRLIVLGLLWLLWNEHADAKLLLALVYLLL